MINYDEPLISINDSTDWKTIFTEFTDKHSKKFTKPKGWQCDTLSSRDIDEVNSQPEMVNFSNYIYNEYLSKLVDFAPENLFLETWINVYNFGHFQETHNHNIISETLNGEKYRFKRALLSFCYILKQPEKNGGGIVFTRGEKIVNPPNKEQSLFPKDIVSGGCVAKGTQITLPDGTTKSVEDFVEGEEVETLDGAKEVTAVWDPDTLDVGTPECYEITFEDGYSVIVSDQHQFLIKNKKGFSWKTANVLAEGDECRTA